MKIVVLVKQVPDTWGARTLDTTTGRLDRGASDAVIDEIGERAIEVALQAKDADKSTEVVVLTMGPSGAKDVLTKGLQMGADSAVHVIDDALAGADMMRTATVLAAAIRRLSPDLVVAGNESTDGRGGMVPAMIAELLGQPHLGNLDTVELVDGVRGQRSVENGTMDVAAALPAIVSVSERVAEPRFASFKGIMAAKKKPVEQLTAADLDSATAAESMVLITTERPARTAGTRITDDGTAATQLAEYLAAARLI
jgi:electron transfer flavoprotein beta subunit